MSEDSQPIEDYLEDLRGHIQVKLARGGAPADRDTLRLVCLAIGQAVLDPAHLQLITKPLPPHLVPLLETMFGHIETDFADEIAELRDVIADAQEDPVWQTHVQEAIQGGAISAELSVHEHIVLLVLSQFVELADE